MPPRRLQRRGRDPRASGEATPRDGLSPGVSRPLAGENPPPGGAREGKRRERTLRRVVAREVPDRAQGGPGVRHSPALVNFSAHRAESIPVRRPGKWFVVLSVLALGGIAAAPARADVTVTVHGVVKTALAVPSVNVPLPGVGPVVRDVQVDVPTDGSTPTITVGRVPVQDPEPTPPVSSPPVSTPAAEPATPAQQATPPAAAAAPADLGARHDPAAPARRSTTAAPASAASSTMSSRSSPAGSSPSS